MKCEQKSQAEHLEAATAKDEGVEPAQDEQERRERQRGEQAAPEDELLPAQIDARNDDRDETPRGGDRGQGYVPSVHAHVAGC